MKSPSNAAAAKPIPHEELVALIARAQQGAKSAALYADGETRSMIANAALRLEIAEGIAARNRVIEANMRLVTKIAAPLATALGLTDHLSDLVQAGVFGPRGASGLGRAIEKYDLASGKRFTTYATPWIRAAIRDAIDEIQDVDVKGGRGHAWLRVKQIRDKLATELEREPTKREVKARCALMGVEAPSDRILERLETGRFHVDYDMSAIPSSEEPERDAETRNMLRALKGIMLRILSDDDRRLLTLRFGLDGGEPHQRDQLQAIFPGVDVDRWQKRIVKKLRIAAKMADRVKL